MTPGSEADPPFTPHQLRVLDAYIHHGTKEAARLLAISESAIHAALHECRRRTGWRTEQLIYEATRRAWLD